MEKAEKALGVKNCQSNVSRSANVFFFWKERHNIFLYMDGFLYTLVQAVLVTSKKGRDGFGRENTHISGC